MDEDNLEIDWEVRPVAPKRKRGVSFADSDDEMVDKELAED